jgi:2-oxoisovalerate dehydrogenase E2 component (dihydrolipoyl transacylase)
MSEVRDFLLPDLGEGLEEGEIVSWLVDVGDAIELNQEIVEVETAKAVVAVPSPFAGTLVEKVGEPGETLEVGSLLCRIDTSGAPAPTGETEQAATPDAEQPSFDDKAAEVEATSGLHGEIKGSNALDADEEPQPLVGYGQSKAGARRRRRGGRAAAGGGNGAVPAGKPLAKPPVRKLAKDLGVDLAAVMPGSGDGGIITRADVHAFAESGQTAAAAPAAREAPSAPTPTPEPAAAPSAPGAAPELTVGAAGEKAVPGFRGRRPGEVEQVKGIRKRIIAKMESSRRDIPHALCATDADLTELWELRRDLTAQARAQGFDVKITPNTLVMRATVLALRRFPTLNAVYDVDAGEIRLLEHINLGVAVDTDRGLMVPNVKDAHTKSTLQLALETSELAARCRDGSATPAELTGGTFTVDNYGYFGNDDGNPIINAPEAGILGLGAIRERPWVVDGELAVRRVARFQLAFDHRICDGGEAGRFVTYVAELCEQPARILLHA